MKILFSQIIILFFSFVIAKAMPVDIVVASPADSIIGTFWSPEKDGKIEIYKIGEKYFGKIIWSKNPRQDNKNPDASQRSRELVGATFLHDFVYDGKGTWTDGTIYDPKSGKTYDCNITLTDSGDLNVRGYVGISLLGRTETFTRIK